MGDIQQNENKNKRPVVRYLLYLLAVVIIIVGAALAKYVSSLSGTDTARAAKFDYEINVSRNGLDTIDDPYDAKIDFNMTDGVGLNATTGNGSQQVEFLVSLYATSMLADAENCEFDKVARVIDVTVTNTSEVTVNAIISYIDEIFKVEGDTGNGIVWCLFNESDSYADYNNILGKLGYTNTSSVPADYDTLIGELNDANEATLVDWNADATLDPNGNSKTLTIVFWAEHEAVAASGWDFEEPGTSNNGPLEQSIYIDYAVTQVD